MPQKDDETHDYQSTLDVGRVAAGRQPAPLPGMVMIYSSGEALLAPMALEDEALVLGRGHVGGVRIEDATMSRRHAQISREGKKWRVRDLGSRNGVIVDGTRVRDDLLDSPRIARMGDSIFIFVDDVRRFQDQRIEPGERVMGPTLKRVWDAIGAAASTGETLHITGESGSGKELAARAFHDLGPRASGPFIAVNCAAIPEGVAERLLFGARKGAFSGAHENSEGYAQAADGGTLFLDEVGELDLTVQAKLLRVLETREVLALGESKPRRVDIRICSATHRDLRAQAAEKRFREDLYFRIGRPHVAIPALRQRPEEIPHLIEREVRRVGGKLTADASFVEACLLRHWPGNVRELLAEVRESARSAMHDGATSIDASRLAAAAGASFEKTRDVTPPPAANTTMPSREVIEETLRREDGRIATTARVLGIHRNQLRRWLQKNNVDAKTFASQPEGNAAEDDDGEDQE